MKNQRSSAERIREASKIALKGTKHVPVQSVGELETFFFAFVKRELSMDINSQKPMTLRQKIRLSQTILFSIANTYTSQWSDKVMLFLLERHLISANQFPDLTQNCISNKRTGFIQIIPKYVKDLPMTDIISILRFSLSQESPQHTLVPLLICDVSPLELQTSLSCLSIEELSQFLSFLQKCIDDTLVPIAHILIWLGSLLDSNFAPIVASTESKEVIQTLHEWVSAAVEEQTQFQQMYGSLKMIIEKSGSKETQRPAKRFRYQIEDLRIF